MPARRAVAAAAVDETAAFVAAEGPERLDKFLAVRLDGFSRTRVKALIDEGRATVNGRPAPARHLVNPGDRVAIALPPFTALPPAAADTVPVLYEDDALIVVDKPAGLVVHPAGPHRDDTLIQRLWPKLKDHWAGRKRDAAVALRPGVVHRLDRGTSGVMVIAKTPAAADALSGQFAARRVKKIYWALVRGIPQTQEGRVTSMVGRSRRAPHRMSVQDPGRASETSFRVLARFPNEPAALLEARPLTGRTHQIRVQLAALGHPLLGDKTYGGPEETGPRPFLHAKSLAFTHPATKRALSFDAPLPMDFRLQLDVFGWTEKSA